jgi:hypothetical protein
VLKSCIVQVSPWRASVEERCVASTLIQEAAL